MTETFFALIETASNQRFIFQSNKLREILGASELVRRAGTDFVDDALPASFDRDAIIVKTSGKALVRFEERRDAEDFVFTVTRRALREAPGLGVFGAVSDGFDVAKASAASAGSTMRRLFEKVGRNRLHLADPVSRFPFHPPARTCATSGLPAENTYAEGAGTREIGAMAAAKRAAAGGAELRLRDLFRNRIVRGVQEIEETEPGWFGVVHADGNGFGQIFMSLADYVVDGKASGYFRLYGDLSRALDRIGRDATVAAAAVVHAREAEQAKMEGRNEPGRLPLLPLIMGGDDLTVLIDGRLAIDFTAAYAEAFEEQVDRDETIGGIVRAAGKTLRFGVGAGVAIVKPHHPFHRAYDLAEELIQSAKRVKQRVGAGASALDFHISFGDSSSSLHALRAGWTTDGGQTRLTARPYVLSDESRLAPEPGASAEANFLWARDHAFGRLAEARRQLSKTVTRDEEKRPALPRSQQHTLRDAIFSGRSTAEGRLDLIRHRYRDVDFSVFGAHDSLFFEDLDGWTQGGAARRVAATRLLDAMEINDVCGELPDERSVAGDTEA